VDMESGDRNFFVPSCPSEGERYCRIGFLGFFTVLDLGGGGNDVCGGGKILGWRCFASGSDVMAS